VTRTLVDRDKPPLLPVTGTLKGATPVEQVTDRTGPENEPEQPDGKMKPAVTTKVTVLVNPLTGVTAIVEEPATVARVVIAGPAIEKSCMVTESVVDLDKVFGAIPVVPVTGTLNGATAVAQLTDRTLPVNEAVQPEGTAPAVRVTVPANPLIGTIAQVELPVTVARVVIPGQLTKKSWMATGTLVVLDNVLGAVPVVPVTGTLNGATPVAH
jgi:hypothetical protein